MILKIRQAGTPVLRQSTSKLSQRDIDSDKIHNLIDHMVDTLRDAPGVGLAAPQVGEKLSIIIIEDREEYHKKVPKELLREQDRQPIPLTVIINPKLTILDQTQAEWFEGCLSVSGYRAIVPRYHAVTVIGLDRQGNTLEIAATGWFARILQHECNHLTGKLYIDTMATRSFMTEKQYNKDWSEKTIKDIQRLISS